MSPEARAAVKHITEFCTDASAKLGYSGPQPVEFWHGTILKMLALARPDSKWIRRNLALTIFDPDYPELCAETARYIHEHGDQGFRHEVEAVQ